MSYEGVREGKAYAKVRFTLAKSAERDDRDTKLQGKAKRGRALKATARPVAAGAPYEPSDAVLDQLRTLRRDGTARACSPTTESGAGERRRRTIRTARSSAG